LTHAQATTKRLEMSTKTPGRQQNNLGKEVKKSFFLVFEYLGIYLFRAKLNQ
jgi:hypothetical protein